VLDTHIVMGNRTGFEHAVWTVINTVSFDQDAKGSLASFLSFFSSLPTSVFLQLLTHERLLNLSVQVFEVVIRVLGGLLAAHLFASTPSVRPEFALPGYKGELLDMSIDLGNRLLPAFDTSTGIPWARVS
jgi:hypothetical protein